MLIRGAVLERTDAQRPFADSRPLTLSELSLDEPGPGEILVRIEAAGVCHSDLSVVDGNRVRPTPMLLGHEAAGIVEAVGSGPDPALVVGDRVVMTFLPRCGECPECQTDGRLPCRVGSAANNAGTLVGGGDRLHRDGVPVAHHLGVSGFATYAVVSATSVVRVDPDVPAEVAALLGCAVLTGGGAVLNAGRPGSGQDVLVVGLGGVGMAAVLVAKATGHRVIGVDALPSKLTLARDLGASDVYSPADAIAAGVRAPVVIEAAGHPAAFETAFALTAPGGTTVTVGLPRPDARSSIAPLTLTSEARTVVGSYLGSSVPARDIPRYVELWRQGLLPVEKLVSARVGLGDLNEAMDALASGEALRQLIVFD
ncbi:alcohol dehydrogenase [Frondihabitans sp. PAMC 28766]|uniref:alcohol dehydrogenase catalytic domain-containing protein n=1 Tax=Frondihabitans sp. PAMC 28766 TaxID=1795630 RepID=UPI00078B8C06|nr:zinc-binding dehydrogenase [Frondihabitans sp. PAMC 28766]AMM20667.1 alcohol dehydrogenase [Frondihabitans sp. PAMC 28766]